MVGHLLEAGGQPVGVLRPHRRQRAQHDQIERALQELDAIARFGFTGHLSGASTGSISRFTELSSGAGSRSAPRAGGDDSLPR